MSTLTDKQKRVLNALPGTANDLAKTLPMSTKTIMRAMECLGAMKLAHVEEWRPPPGGGRRVAYYVAGEGVDAEKPGRAATHMDAFAKQGRRFHIMADDATFQLRVSRVKVWRDPLVEALFGPAKAAA